VRTITSRQLIWSLVSITSGVGILGLSRGVAQEAGRDGWIAVILGAIIPFLNLIFTSALALRYPNSNLALSSQAILGKLLGKTFSLFFSLYCLSAVIVIINIFITIVSLIALPTVPIGIITLTMLLICAYYASHDIRILGRMNEFLFYFLILIMPTLLIAVPYLKIEYLLPMFQASLPQILAATKQSLLAYTGFELLLVIYPFLEKKEELIPAGLVAIGIVVTTYLYVSLICLSYYGPIAIKHFIWPLLGLLDSFSVPVVERLELIFLFLWVVIVFRTVGLYIFAASYTAAQIFNIKSHKIFCYLSVVITFFFIQKIDNIFQGIDLGTYVGYVSIVINLALPLFLLLVSIILGKKEGKNG